MKDKILSFVFGVSLFLTCLMAAVPAAVYDKPFFMSEAKHNLVCENTGLSMEEVSTVTDGIFDYLKGTRQDFDITIEREGKVIHIFDENEQKHMVDVEALMVFQRTTLFISLILVLFIGTWLYRKHRKRFAKTLVLSGIVGLVVLVVATIIASTGFTNVFITLHEMIFSNELWLMDPATEVLINIVPEPYFIHLALYAGGVTAFGCLSVLTLGLLLKRKANP